MADKIHNLICTVSKYNINVQDSYQVMDKKEIAEILHIIEHRYPECEVFKVRKWNNLISEWRAHSRLYNWGLFKSHTKDVDLDTEEPWWRRILYTIVGM